MAGALKGAFTLLESGAKSADSVSSTLKVLKQISSNTLDLSSIVAKLDVHKFADKFGTTVSSVKKTSSILDTGKYVAKFTSAIPSSSDDILSSIGSSLKSVDNLPVTSIKSISGSVTPKTLQTVANSNSLSRLSKLSDSITAGTKTTATLNVSSIARRSTDVLTDNAQTVAKNIPPINKLDDIAPALKSSKGVLGKTDDIADIGKAASKQIDDVADTAKVLKKSEKFLQFAKKYDSLINISILGGFLLGAHTLSKNIDESESDPLRLVTDPASDKFTVALFGDHSVIAEEEVGLTDVLMSKEVLIGIFSAIVVMFSI